MNDYQLDNIVSEYSKQSVPVDALAYTSRFTAIVRDAGLEPTRANLHHAYRHLRQLQRHGMLPRLKPEAQL